MSHQRCPDACLHGFPSRPIAPLPPSPSPLLLWPFSPERDAPAPPPALAARADAQRGIAGQTAVARDGARHSRDGGCDNEVRRSDSLSECAPLRRVGLTDGQAGGVSLSSSQPPSRPRWWSSASLPTRVPLPPTRPPTTLLQPPLLLTSRLIVAEVWPR